MKNNEQNDDKLDDIKYHLKAINDYIATTHAALMRAITRLDFLQDMLAWDKKNTQKRSKED